MCVLCRLISVDCVVNVCGLCNWCMYYVVNVCGLCNWCVDGVVNVCIV